MGAAAPWGRQRACSAPAGAGAGVGVEVSEPCVLLGCEVSGGGFAWTPSGMRSAMMVRQRDVVHAETVGQGGVQREERSQRWLGGWLIGTSHVTSQAPMAQQRQRERARAA